ncbi:MAG: NAD+ synthase [Acidibacillus sp.]|uniref:NH(3)-dependent NAD(+) synthetase n=1 Tax=Sulfoacidibacillus ferrooxidans TaxID=2005001 RepID=A0A9X1V766_9BACL|nr:NAD+ synthase [Sulfoacidibacillus ferrooxidans]MCI0182030.1 NH(3)-dependent NAD(+) synthetase [Sulfoacidibacillus ferrooxidans]MCY0892406.1 NAD+ synthase [Acidibacillus sp.]
MTQSEMIAKKCESLEHHVADVIPILVEFLRQEVEKSGFGRVVFGLSGGIDSAVVAYLAVAAFGRDRVHPIIMPYKTSSKSSVADAKEVLAALDLPLTMVDISPQIDTYFGLQEDATALRKGNKMARERMSIIYDQSAKLKALPLGTSNKTELLLGYGTQFGDLASALNPIGDLYKTQIRRLARLLSVPLSIIEKPPSADLWEDQTDESDFGFTYEEADVMLHMLIDERLSPEEVIERGFEASVVESIMRRIRQNQFKRRMPIIAKLSSRTIGIDFRYSRDWGM